MARVGFALLFGLTMLARMEAQPLPDAAAPLAARISSLLPPRATVSLDLQVMTPAAMPESSSFRSALEDALRKTGLDLSAAAPPESRLRVTVAENARGLLLVAEVPGKDARQVIMLPWTGPLPGDAKPALRLVIHPVWEQTEPVLDFTLLDSDSELLVLSPTRITTLRLANGKWMPSGQAFLRLDQPAPRDPRGRLEFSRDALHAYLPDTTCTGQTTPQFVLNCAPGNDPWSVDPRDATLQVRWYGGNNELVSSEVKSTFYNAAQGLFASSQGSIEDRAGHTAPGTDAWGNDLAGLENPCASGRLLIVALAGDKPDRDQVQVFELIGGQPVARSEALALSGRVTALWPSEKSGEAALVVRNAQTGIYEASRLAVACAN